MRLQKLHGFQELHSILQLLSEAARGAMRHKDLRSATSSVMCHKDFRSATSSVRWLRLFP